MFMLQYLGHIETICKEYDDGYQSDALQKHLSLDEGDIY